MDSELTAYLYRNGLDIDELNVDQNDQIYVTAKYTDDDGKTVEKQIAIPQEFQTLSNASAVSRAQYTRDTGYPYDFVDEEIYGERPDTELE